MAAFFPRENSDTRFARWLRLLRAEHRLTQQACADLVGTHHSHWARWETGLLRPNEASCQRILDVFGGTSSFENPEGIKYLLLWRDHELDESPFAAPLDVQPPAA